MREHKICFCDYCINERIKKAQRIRKAFIESTMKEIIPEVKPAPVNAVRSKFLFTIETNPCQFPLCEMELDSLVALYCDPHLDDVKEHRPASINPILNKTVHESEVVDNNYDPPDVEDVEQTRWQKFFDPSNPYGVYDRGC